MPSVINAQTKISAILKSCPAAIDAIVAISPKFAKLKNPILRRVMAPRVNIAQASKIGGCTPQDFFEALQPLGFIIDTKMKTEPVELLLDEKPEWLLHADEKDIKIFDVRPILEGKQDPLKHILHELKMLDEGQILCILNTFEPTPLIHLLNRKGHISHVEKMREDEIYTWFKKGGEADSETVNLNGVNEFEHALTLYKNRLVEIDVRDLEMPQPMLQILEKLKTLPENNALYVHHKRVPVYLLDELQELGYQYHTDEISEGNVKMIIHKNE